MIKTKEMGMRIAICDDEMDDIKTIEQYVFQIAENRLDLDVSVFQSSIDFLANLENNCNYNIIFLDYEMDIYNGHTIGMKIRELGNLDCVIIFISNHSEVIFHLLDTDVFNFIEKPIDFFEFKQVFLAALNKITQSPQNIAVKQGRRHILIALKEIIYLESMWRQVMIYTINEEILIYDKLDVLEKRLNLPTRNFVRIGKSHLVNLDYSKHIGPERIVMKDGMEFKISNNYKNSCKEAFQEYMRRRNTWNC